MNNKIIKALFSMRMMAICMIIFAFAVGAATFIESDYGTPASKIAVYNSNWFAFLLFYLFFILIYNILDFRMYRKEKIPTLMFHVSFLIIIIGAGLTRYVGFEGQMRIKEKTASNILFSSDPYFTLKADDQKNQMTHTEQRWLSEGVQNPFSFNYQLPGHEKVNVEYVAYEENLIDTLIHDEEEGKDALVLVVRGQDNYLFEGQQTMLGNGGFAFNVEHPSMPGVEIIRQDGKLKMTSKMPFQKIEMSTLSKEDQMTNNIDPEAVAEIPADSLIDFVPMNMYVLGQEMVVFKALRSKVKKIKVKAPKSDMGDTYLTIKLSTDNDSRKIQFQGSEKHIITPNYFQFAGQNFEVSYGAKPIELPFYIRCDTFELARYPGSDMASSYASEVTVLDTANNVFHPQRIFMNRVMDYSGYRFFQSSYFPDESGTILSVNYDWWGTTVTYIGYFLMSLGMIWTIFNPKGRMRELGRIIKKSRANRMKMMKTLALIIAIGLGGTTATFAQYESQELSEISQRNNEQKLEETHTHDHSHEHSHSKAEIEKVSVSYLSEENAEQLNDLLIQDYDGRIIPYHTLASKLLRKIHRSDTYNGKNAVQTITAIHLYGPGGWYHRPIIYVSPKINDQLGIEKIVSVDDLEDAQGNFKWMNEYKEAHEKTDASKTEFDNQLIKLGERYRVLKETLAFQYFRVIPIPDDDNGTWVWPFGRDLKGSAAQTNTDVLNVLRNLYLVSEQKSHPETGEKVTMEDVQKHLTKLKDHQWEDRKKYEATHPEAEPLTHKHVNVEIAYNKLKIFDKIQNSYLLLGIVLMILFFIRTLITPTLKREKIMERITYVLVGFTALVFIGHGVGLGMRWYITGHAPWSDGYEAVVFIAWATVLAGLFFVRKNPAVIAATTLLAALMIFVTKLNMLDPEITPLEPVLKSYWLMIHVAVITSSYGFLGISAMLGFVNMVLYLSITDKNRKRLNMNIIEITSASEMLMIVGLVMLSMGTFIGGIWANESWGRYWGWDPKEVWALVSMLVYATIIHLRWIPSLSSRLLFNILSLWGYSAILFTFFGVNFILVGLHSYAQGDGVQELPNSVIISVVVFGLFTLATVLKYYRDKKNTGSKKIAKS